MSRNMHLNGERKIRLEDISFESEVFNIYDPFFTSESDASSDGCSDDSDFTSDSNSFKSLIDDDGYYSETNRSSTGLVGGNFSRSSDDDEDEDKYGNYD